jgi:hypothetical protein
MFQLFKLKILNLTFDVCHVQSTLYAVCVIFDLYNACSNVLVGFVFLHLCEIYYDNFRTQKLSLQAVSDICPWGE